MTDRAAIYLRVSSKAQAGEDRASLPVQIAECTAYCARHGWQVVMTAEDHESGKIVSREGYQRLLELARTGLVEHIVVYSSSRLGRRSSERIYRRDELEDMGIQLHSCTDNIEDKLSHDLLAVIDDNELRRIQKRVGPAKRYKAEQGYYVGGKLPFGLEREKTKQGSILKPGPRFDIVRLAFQLAAGGTSLAEITRRVNALLSPQVMDRTSVRDMLLNRHYTGRNLWLELDVAARWEPMIDPDLYAAANRALRRRYHQRVRISAEHPSWLLGLAHCGHCGARMVSAQKVVGGKLYPYMICGKYHRGDRTTGCSARQNVNVQLAQAFVLEYLDGWRLAQGSTVERIEAFSASRRADIEAKLQLLRAEKGRLRERVRRAQADRLDDPASFSLADVAEIRRGAEDAIAAHDEELLALERSLDSTDAYEGLQRLLQDAAWLDNAGSKPEAFHRFVQHFIDRVDVYGRGRYEVKLQPALEAVAVR